MMPRSLNRCAFIGRPVAHPTPGKMPNGVATSAFILEVPDSDKRSTLVPISAEGRVADICNKLLRRGREVYVEGKLQLRHSGNQVVTEIILENMQLLGSRDIDQSDQDDPPTS
jgi:single-stranded DNA-binding protein